MTRHGGFTLIELIITLAIAAILLTVGVPSFQDTIKNSRISSQANEFITDLNYARNVAVTQKNAITICQSSNGTSCGVGTTWQQGWIVINNFNGANTVLRMHGPLSTGMTLSAGSTTQVAYSSTGAATPNAITFQLRLSGCTGNQQRNITIGPTGRPMVSTIAC